MTKLAIVVQRCHESVVGGSETLAWQYATLLKEAYEVDVLTTTALHISDWANVLPEGLEIKDGINMRRFPVTIGRSPYWGLLHDRLWAEYPPRALGKRRISNPRYLKWSLSFQEEFIRTQGPYSAPLLDFISQRWSEYKTIIFVTYLYPTTYFGLLQVPNNYAFLAPTLHDEPTAYLSAYKHAAHRARSIIWLTDAERRLGGNLWGELPGQVVSARIETTPRPPAKLTRPYLLYCGRIDPNKGCRELFDYFIRFKSEFPSDLCLVLAGKDDLPIPSHPDIEFRGFVSEDEKYSLMAGAKLFVMPSRNESFSFVTMEAMAQETPVLASSGSEVLADHLAQSGAGRLYNDYRSFSTALTEMLSAKGKLAEMGRRGREYATSQFNSKTIRASLLDLLSQVQPEESILPKPEKSVLPTLEEPAILKRLTSPRVLPSNPKISMSVDQRLTVRTANHGHTVKLVQYPLTNMPGELFYARPETYDARIFEDVAVNNEYNLPERFNNTDTIIDIGAHIGSFSYAALMRGAGKVYSYEAHPVNYGITVQNLAKFGNRAVCSNLAVWRSDEPERTLYNDVLNGPYQPNTGGISVLWNNEGVPIGTVSLDELLLAASHGLEKSVRLLKLDCEGSEYPILFTAKYLYVVQEICGEYHEIEPERVPARAVVGNRPELFNRYGLKEFLEAQGYSVELKPQGEADGIFHARREN